MDADTGIREVIRSTMATQGLTQAELARRLAVKPPSVANVLSGKRGAIPRSLLNVLDALELELHVLPKQSRL